MQLRPAGGAKGASQQQRTGGVGAQMGGDTKLQAIRDRDGPAHQEPILLLIIYSQITFL
jgi:hypothetical protein